MCGIIAYLGLEEAKDFIFKGLQQLQNRGYDSAGICTIHQSTSNNNFIITKYASQSNITSLQKLEKELPRHSFNSVGIGHTRWATHGEKNDTNSHPHIDTYQRFALVHNGIIDNFSTFKDLLSSHNFTFNSETDSEVIVNLISYFYNQEKDTFRAIKKTISQLKGSFALCILDISTPNKLYCVRRENPLLINIKDSRIIVSSEISGFCNDGDEYIMIDNDDLVIAELKNGKINILTKQSYTPYKIDIVNISLSPDPYPYWTIKEIMEQPYLVEKLCSRELEFKEIIKIIPRDINNILLIGCGTSLYAGEIGCIYLKNLNIFNVVQAFDGAEFNIQDLPKMGKTAIIFISQSGETKDLFLPIEIAKKNKIFTIGLINVKNSYISKQVDLPIYINAEREVGVASTKAFTLQVLNLYILSKYLSKKNNLEIELYTKLSTLSFNLIEMMRENKDSISQVVNYLIDWSNLFILGKGIQYYFAKEASLKLKEIGYIHAEAYNSSALKHGPYSLITPNFPVIIFVNKDDYLDKNRGIIEEIKARQGFIITISEIEIEKSDINLKIPFSYDFHGIYTLILIQLISYQLALLKGHNPDMPRNLAKVVTVD